MPQPSFHAFSSIHFVTLGIGFAVIAILIIFALKSWKGQHVVTVLLAFLNFAAFPAGLWAWSGYPKTLDNVLPFHLCDVAAIIAGLALLTRKPILMTLTYFWGIAATTQALLTPAIPIGPPALPFFHFFLQHFAIVAAALYLPIVIGWRPKRPIWRSPLEVFAISVAYHWFTVVLNLVLKTNFAFSLRPPHTPSLIDHLGPWPVYLFVMEGIALVLYLLLALPFRKENDDFSRLKHPGRHSR